MTNKNRDNLDLLQKGSWLWFVAIGYLAMTGYLCVFGMNSNFALGLVFVALVALSGGLFFLAKRLKQLTDKQGDITQNSPERMDNPNK
ncbi:MAG: hypothetical protein OXH84_00295 [Gammaproteobacteria bacterium]|nr:hypothetical protein [Gammaproteobacteria bacterium]